MNKMTWMCLVFIITLALSRSEGSSGFLSFDSERDNVLLNDNEESLQQDDRIFDHELEDILRFLAQEQEVSNDEFEPSEDNTEDSQQTRNGRGRGSFETISEPESSDSSDSSSSDSSDDDLHNTRNGNGRGSFETVDEPEESAEYQVGKQKSQAGFEEGQAGDTEDFKNSHNGRGSFETFEEPEVVESTDYKVGKQQDQAGFLTKGGVVDEDSHTTRNNGRGSFETFEEPEGTL